MERGSQLTLSVTSTWLCLAHHSPSRSVIAHCAEHRGIEHRASKFRVSTGVLPVSFAPAPCDGLYTRILVCRRKPSVVHGVSGKAEVAGDDRMESEPLRTGTTRPLPLLLYLLQVFRGCPLPSFAWERRLHQRLFVHSNQSLTRTHVVDSPSHY